MDLSRIQQIHPHPIKVRCKVTVFCKEETSRERFAMVLRSVVTEETGSDNKRQAADVRSKGFSLSSEELCRRNCITVLRQENACPLSTVCSLLAKSFDKYWVKQAAFRKMDHRKTQSPLDLSVSYFMPLVYLTSCVSYFLCLYAATSYLAPAPLCFSYS